MSVRQVPVVILNSLPDNGYSQDKKRGKDLSDRVPGGDLGNQTQDAQQQKVNVGYSLILIENWERQKRIQSVLCGLYVVLTELEFVSILVVYYERPQVTQIQVRTRLVCLNGIWLALLGIFLLNILPSVSLHKLISDLKLFYLFSNY